MRTENIAMLTDTLKICEQGHYNYNGKKVELKLSPDEMRNVRVFLPDEVDTLAQFKDFHHVFILGGRGCGHGCENMDSFSLARRRYEDFWYHFKEKDAKEILVLNLANAINPGGGVRRGANAQEEDLCRKSSLLLSLESAEASKYYDYNKSLHTPLGSDAIIITPKVEIIKDEKGNLLDQSVVVAVMTCAAPNLREGLGKLTHKQYQELVYGRILGMLRCAAYMGYRFLVLGAFGCGAFRNDAKVVSDLFFKALKEFQLDGMAESSIFRRIDFAVLTKDAEDYNYQHFYRNFGGHNFFRKEDAAERRMKLDAIRATEVNLDKIRGSLVGGAIGDALGYPIEFWSVEQILNRYGEPGITEYELDWLTGSALISDDTQMSLFTANGLLACDTRICLRGIGGWPQGYVAHAYRDWLTTQEADWYTEWSSQRNSDPDTYTYTARFSWLLDVPELYSRRAPGNTCLSALKEDDITSRNGKYTDKPYNQSKGCGGIMRIAPVGLYYSNIPLEKVAHVAAEVSAITHGHPLGYLTSAVLACILNRLVFPVNPLATLREIIIESTNVVCELFKDKDYLPELRGIIVKALELAENNDSDKENIKKLGEGWVAEETLAIALYCALRYEHDFSNGIIAAVNHDGDSDSTGALVGNILGAINGYGAIENKWKQDLELLDVILEMADDLCHGCHMSEYSSYTDPDWLRKYVYMRWRETEK